MNLLCVFFNIRLKSCCFKTIWISKSSFFKRLSQFLNDWTYELYLIIKICNVWNFFSNNCSSWIIRFNKFFCEKSNEYIWQKRRRSFESIKKTFNMWWIDFMMRKIIQTLCNSFIFAFSLINDKTLLKVIIISWNFLHRLINRLRKVKSFVDFNCHMKSSRYLKFKSRCKVAFFSKSSNNFVTVSKSVSEVIISSEILSLTQQCQYLSSKNLLWHFSSYW